MPLLGYLSISHKPISMFTSQPTQSSNVLINGMATCNPLPVHYLFHNGLPSCDGIIFWSSLLDKQGSDSKVISKGDNKIADYNFIRKILDADRSIDSR